MSDISQIQVNGTTYDLCDATARTDILDLQQSVSRIGTIFGGSFDNVTVAAKADGKLAEIDITPGTYIVIGCCQWNASDNTAFTANIYLGNTNKCTYRGNATYGGGAILVACVEVSINNKLSLHINNPFSSPTAAVGISLRSVRII